MTSWLAFGAATAQATPIVQICLVGHTSWCATIKDGNDVSGNTVWLNTKQSGRDNRWYEVPVPCSDTTGCLPGCSVDSCTAFESYRNPSVCLAISSSGFADLTACGLSGGGTARAAWLENGTHLRDVFWAQDMAVATPLVAEDRIAIAPTGAGGVLEAWTGQ